MSAAQPFYSKTCDVYITVDLGARPFEQGNQFGWRVLEFFDENGNDILSVIGFNVVEVGLQFFLNIQDNAAVDCRATEGVPPPPKGLEINELHILFNILINNFDDAKIQKFCK